MRLNRSAAAALFRSVLPASVFISAFLLVQEPGGPGTASDARERAARLAERAARNAQPKDDWFFVKRAYPRMALPEDVSGKLGARRVLFREKQAARAPSSAAAWTSIGPTNIGGRITAVLIHPSDPDIVYAGAASGGVWKTTDFGLTWTNIFNESFSIGSLAFEPTDPSVVYVGTGESNPSSVDTYPGNGLWRSTDAGTSWTNVGLAETGHIAKVAVNPLNPSTIYVAAFGLYRSKNVDKGVYRSFDRGATWARVLQVDSITGATDLQIDPDDTSRVLAATHTYYRTLPTVQRGGAGSGLWITTNAGGSWTQVTSGFPFNDAAIGSISLDYSKSSPSIAYATVAGGGGFNWDGVYRSVDDGHTWTKVFTNGGAFSEGQVWYNNILRVHPLDANRLWAGMTSMYGSTDGGVGWGFAAISGDYHVDHHAVEYAPSDPSKMVFGNDGGIFTSTDGGATWVHAENLPITQFYAGTVAHQSRHYVMGGSQDNSTKRTRSSVHDEWSIIFGGDGFNCAVDPTDSSRIYAEYQNGGLVYSTNGGSSWFGGTSGIVLSEGVNWQMPYVLDPQNPKKLYAGTRFLYRSTNGAVSWTKISPNLTYNLTGFYSTLSTIDVSPADSNVVYVGTGDGRVWVTTNGGGTWTDIAAGLPLRWVSRVTGDHTSPGTAYVTLSGFREYDNQGHIYRTTDYGASWTDIGTGLPDIPLNEVLVDPLHAQTLYIASDLNVMTTTDLGASWAELGTGLPGVTVHDLHIHAPTRMLAAFTHGRSAYTIDLPDPPSFNVAVEIQPRWNLLSNPVDSTDLLVSAGFPDALSPAYGYVSGSYSSGDTLHRGSGYWVKFPEIPVSPRAVYGAPLDSATVAVSAGWNIVGSVSADVPVASIASDPPGLVTSQFFGYDGAYYTATDIEPGKGYWVKVSAGGVLILSTGPSAAGSLAAAGGASVHAAAGGASVRPAAGGASVHAAAGGVSVRPAAGGASVHAADRPAGDVGHRRIVIRPTAERPPAPPAGRAPGGPRPDPSGTGAASFRLAGNFPNPFNPVTTISFELPREGRARLAVYDEAGRLVEVLVDGVLPAGGHSAVFDGRELSSGVYLYRLESAGGMLAGKMALVK